MNINESRTANRYALELVASYLSVDNQKLQDLYDELLEDSQFLREVNRQIIHYSENELFTKGLFGKGAVDNVDWFGFQRILIYILIRFLRPKYSLETGVYYGGNTAFMLNALYKNGDGQLVSIDYPDSQIREKEVAESRHQWVEESELYSATIQPGFLVPEYLRNYWDLKIGSSLDVIPKLTQQFEFYIHDSDHAFKFLKNELDLARSKMVAGGCMVVDDINWSNALYSYVAEKQLYPCLLPDNGKGGVLVRTALIKLQHENENLINVTY